MSKIEHVNNWGSHATLDGEPIRDMELLRVTWPDGTEETVRVYLWQQTNGGWSDEIAKVHVIYKGAAALVSLDGIEARRLPRCTCDNGTCEFCQAQWQARARR